MAKDLEHVYKYLSHCLREIIRSSPTPSSSKPQDIHEEVIQPKYKYKFELVEMRPEKMIDWRNGDLKAVGEKKMFGLW